MGKRLLILGAGGHGKVVREITEIIKDKTGSPKYEIVHFLDDNVKEAIGKISELYKLKNKYDEAFCAIGDNFIRKEIQEKIKETGMEIPVLVHPTSYVSSNAKIGKGVVIEANAVVNTGTVIEDGCIISAGAVIDHDVFIGQFAHINVGAICKSGSRICEMQKVDAGEIINNI